MPVIDHHLFILWFHFVLLLLLFFENREEANERAQSCYIYIQKVIAFAVVAGDAAAAAALWPDRRAHV